MSGSSNLATMIVISLLSHHPCVGATSRRSVNEHDVDASVDNTANEEATMLLEHASIIFAVTFSVATCLQRSPLELIRNNNGQQGNRIARDSPHPISTARNSSRRLRLENCRQKFAPMTQRSTLKVGRRRGLERRRSQVAINTRSSEESSSSVSDISDFYDSYTSHSNSRKAKSLVHTTLKTIDSTNSLQSISEYANIPGMTASDSLLSLSSEFSLFSTRGSGPSSLSVASKKINYNNTSQGNDEWNTFVREFINSKQ